MLVLRRAFQRDDRQMTSSFVEVDFDGEPIAGLSGNECLRLGTGRTASPASARLNPWLAIVYVSFEVHFRQRLSFERHVIILLNP